MFAEMFEENSEKTLNIKLVMIERKIFDEKFTSKQTFIKQVFFIKHHQTWIL